MLGSSLDLIRSWARGSWLRRAGPRVPNPNDFVRLDQLLTGPLRVSLPETVAIMMALGELSEWNGGGTGSLPAPDAVAIDWSGRVRVLADTRVPAHAVDELLAFFSRMAGQQKVPPVLKTVMERHARTVNQGKRLERFLDDLSEFDSGNRRLVLSVLVGRWLQVLPPGTRAMPKPAASDVAVDIAPETTPAPAVDVPEPVVLPARPAPPGAQAQPSPARPTKPTPVTPPSRPTPALRESPAVGVPAPVALAPVVVPAAPAVEPAASVAVAAPSEAPVAPTPMPQPPAPIVERPPSVAIAREAAPLPTTPALRLPDIPLPDDPTFVPARARPTPTAVAPEAEGSTVLATEIVPARPAVLPAVPPPPPSVDAWETLESMPMAFAIDLGGFSSFAQRPLVAFAAGLVLGMASIGTVWWIQSRQGAEPVPRAIAERASADGRDSQSQALATADRQAPAASIVERRERRPPADKPAVASPAPDGALPAEARSADGADLQPVEPAAPAEVVAGNDDAVHDAPRRPAGRPTLEWRMPVPTPFPSPTGAASAATETAAADEFAAGDSGVTAPVPVRREVPGTFRVDGGGPSVGTLEVLIDERGRVVRASFFAANAGLPSTAARETASRAAGDALVKDQDVVGGGDPSGGEQAIVVARDIVTAARQWRFTPARRNGRSVRYRALVRVSQVE
ncbi:MAG: hypothetical protein U0Q12_16315 [Vicinamibacterales bacterium]